MVQGSVARHQPTGLGQQAESGSSPRMSRRGERGSRVPTEAGWASRIAGRCGFRIGKADFEPRVNRPQGVPPRGLEPRTAGGCRREWQLRAGAEPVPGTIPCLSSFLAAPEHPQRRGLRWLAKAALLLCRLQGFAFHVSRFTLSHVAETGTDVNA